MKQLELNLEKIALIGVQKEKENFDFRIYLKRQDAKKVDEIVHRLDNEITSQIDCQQCGNCCKTLRPSVTELEIVKLSRIENLTPTDFIIQFIELDNYGGSQYLKGIPCRYLKNKICKIYTERPADCKSYPHTQKTDFITRTFAMIDNYSICPIVFNLMERLKLELGYNR